MAQDPRPRLTRTARSQCGRELPLSRRTLVRAASLALAGLALPARGAGAAPPSLIVPARLRIPTIGVDAGIEQVHILDGVMEAPRDPWRVGWYAQLAVPGRPMDLVLAGHKDWWGTGPAVFWSLTELAAGDVAVLDTHDGRSMRYGVATIEEVPVTEPPHTYLLGAGPNALTLMTCAGAFVDGQYTSRLVVRCARVG